MVGGRKSAVALLGLGLVVAGCGSSSSSSSNTSSTAAAPALTKAEYLKQGNAICKASHAKRQVAFMAYATAHHLNPDSTLSKAQDIQLSTTIAIPNIQAQISAIKALVPPSIDQAQVTAMPAAAQQDLDRAKQDPAMLATSGRQFADSGGLLHAYGLKSCAKNTG